MIITGRSIILKDGKSAYVRSPALSDVASIYGFISSLYSESEYMLRTADEAGKFSIEAGRRFVEKLNRAPGDCMLMCFIDGVLVGCCIVTYGKLQKTVHRGTVSIGVRKDCWGRGIGRALMEIQIATARLCSSARQLELDYIDGNTRAGALYESLGFSLTGKKPGAVMQPDGSFRDMNSMILKLK